jgi:hypothetical protein
MRAEPYLSVVVATRDDDHGGDPGARLKAALKVYKRQAEKFRFPLEYIIVDWNSPVKRAGVFAQVKTWDLKGEFLKIRVIEVPPRAHKKIDDAKIPFYQMIAKNVGIRRARGRFVLATNIDIFLEEELFKFLSKKELKPNRMYRSDRIDLAIEVIKEQPNQEPFQIPDKLKTRKHVRSRSFVKKDLKIINNVKNFAWPEFDSKLSMPKIWKEKVRLWKKKLGIRGSPGFQLHTNGCGDFTLLSRAAWHSLRGYPEFRIFSFHIDSVFCHQAHESGYFELCLPPSLVHYHIDHSAGWTPETDDQLLERLRAKNIPFIESQMDILIEGCRRAQKPLFNDEHWGLIGQVFPDRHI